MAAVAGALDAQLAANAAAEPDLAARIREAGIEFVYYQFVTLNGRVMAKVVPARHLARNLERGVQFHGSAVADLATSRAGTLIASGNEAEEFVAVPEAATFRVLPWDDGFARMFCNLYQRRDRAVGPGAPLPTCVRSNLARVHARVPRAHRARAALRHRAGDELARARTSSRGRSRTSRRPTTSARSR